MKNKIPLERGWTLILNDDIVDIDDSLCDILNYEIIDPIKNDETISTYINNLVNPSQKEKTDE